MSSPDWKFLLGLAGFGWTVLLTLWTRYVANQSATKADIRAQERAVEEIRVRLAKVETRLDQTPSAGALHGITISVSALEGDIKKLAATVEPLARSTRRIEDYLLNERKK